MKALFLLFHGFEESNGISKKILSQIKALKECGVDTSTCFYDVDRNQNRVLMVNRTVLKNFGNTTWGKVKKRVCFTAIAQHIVSEDIRLVYIRSFHNANPFTIRFIRQLKKKGIKVVMEIPTYPYDQEYITLQMKAQLLMDKLFRKQLANQLDAIVTFSNEKQIFGKQTISISNGIDFSSIPLKQKTNGTPLILNLIGVAEVHYWHGFDRVIKGLANYYQKERKYKIYFHLVGNLSGQREKEEILIPIEKYNLSQYVILHGAKHGKELDQLFDQADMGIGSLGRHRSHITHIKTLKNREYAARGIPFIYSEADSDFDNKPFVLKATPDDTPIDLENLTTFYYSQQWNPSNIRSSITELSWKNQMQKIMNRLSP